MSNLLQSHHQQHPLFIPDITFSVKVYLNNPDYIALYNTSRCLRNLFAPTVWENICFLPDLLRHYSSYQESITRVITLGQLLDPYTLNLLQENRHWVRSLSISNHISLIALDFAEKCSNLRALEIRGFYSKDKGHDFNHYWQFYHKIMEKHLSNLHSITLINWSSPFSGISMLDDPRSFNPIPVHSIRSLTLRKSVVRKNHLSSFWVIFQHLEVLKLIETKIDLVALEKLAILMNSTTSTDGLTILPNLQELVIHKLKPNDAHTQFRILISRCLLLRKLDWYFAPHYTSAMDSFLYNLFLGKPLFLDYLIINFYTSGPADTVVHQILKMTDRPLKALDVKAPSISDRTFNLRSNYFSTLQTIDLVGHTNWCFTTYNPRVFDDGARGDWTMQILTSCPVLEVLKSKVLSRDDIISSGRWVCRRLKIFSVFIHMGKVTHGPYGRFTTGELQDCQFIYQRLADLEELQELDMRPLPLGGLGFVDRNDRSVYRKSLAPLPLRLKAGLGYLSRLTKLESLTFWAGYHVVPKREFIWMLDHWKRLRSIFGSYRIKWRSAPSIQDKYLWAGKLHEWLTSKGIQVRCYYEEYTPEQKITDGYQDCCGLSDDEDEDGNED